MVWIYLAFGSVFLSSNILAQQGYNYSSPPHYRFNEEQTHKTPSLFSNGYPDSSGGYPQGPNGFSKNGGGGYPRGDQEEGYPSAGSNGDSSSLEYYPAAEVPSGNNFQQKETSRNGKYPAAQKQPMKGQPNHNGHVGYLAPKQQNGYPSAPEGDYGISEEQQRPEIFGLLKQGGDRGDFQGGDSLASPEAEGDLSGIPGKPGVDYPILSDIPQTSFSCDQQQYPGYYADIEARCQVFHICANNRTFNFLCPNGSIFHQQILVCVWWNDFDCDSAPSLYYVNSRIYDETGNGNGLDGLDGTSEGQAYQIPGGSNGNGYPSSNGLGRPSTSPQVPTYRSSNQTQDLQQLPYPTLKDNGGYTASRYPGEQQLPQDNTENQQPHEGYPNASSGFGSPGYIPPKSNGGFEDYPSNEGDNDTIRKPQEPPSFGSPMGNGFNTSPQSNQRAGYLPPKPFEGGYPSVQQPSTGYPNKLPHSGGSSDFPGGGSSIFDSYGNSRPSEGYPRGKQSNGQVQEPTRKYLPPNGRQMN